ncbi:hypothetical protein BJ165DRAFT_284656 [Panaeolus papilionaceus]|nr:hypothetical protein BJ165DRAFT_284656 [Panaeolus papilionaceus]
MSSRTPSDIFSHPNLDTIPSDLFLHICRYYLRPKDLLHLRQTCKSMTFATRECSIWTCAARRACKENLLYEPSFDIPNMSARALEHLSTGTYRFNQVMRLELEGADKNGRYSFYTNISRSFHASHIPPTGLVPTLNPVRIHELNPGWSRLLTKMQLIPGGRFLVTVDTVSRSALLIYDLSLVDQQSFNDGAPSSDPHFQPCFEIDLKQPNLVDFSIHPSPPSEHNAVRFLLKYATDNSPTLLVQIIDIDLSRTPAVTRRRTSFTTPVRPHSSLLTSLSEDVVLMISDRIATVWNCATNKCAQWNIPKKPAKVCPLPRNSPIQ